ncbi:hypothetical protein BURMUCGD2M_1522 [Burkholderia multivorans CGD2M]|uniref:Uncharacterized protein n=1 Tax=Burkholderia multivorans CGD2 TaxID=513052 RepID=B9BYX2_9BURK|nr:hypothetical protein BURMUCGD2_1425 [Burkholderia multivorans CGD2]EEE14822.1 hypothetical protein BURMUCGD2M_1522 [Burkholderia multivorans CGD2M]
MSPGGGAADGARSGWPCVRRWRFAIYVVCRRMTWYAGRGAMASRVYPGFASMVRCR